MDLRDYIPTNYQKIKYIFLSLLITFSLSASTNLKAQNEDDHDHGAADIDSGSIGAVDFRVSCEESVKQDFDHALGMMHHMMYERSRSEFEAIAEKDPECAMAYWGIATTLFQPIWPTRPSQEDLAKGWDNIQKAKQLGPDTDREKALVSATEGFFKDPETAEFNTRINRWAEAVKKAYDLNPDDHDIAAFYALSRLAIAQRAEDPGPLHDEAESVLRSIYEKEETHPGAVHYTIHSNDADGRAEKSLDIVRSYGEIAPEVAHALHMPTHIYVRLGNWDEVIAWNTRSADAALKHPAGDKVSHHYAHAVDYMVYAYLQRGENDKAQASIKELSEKGNHQASFISAFHLAAIPARYAVERREWAEAAALSPRNPDYLPWDQATWAEGLSWYARGLGALHNGDTESAKNAEKKLATLREKSKAEGEDNFANYIEVDRLILSGWIAHKADKPEEAERLIRSAAELEGRTEKHPVTPGALLPPNEALGDLLMELDRPEDALEAYKTSDDIWPGRYNTLLGAARAAAKSDDKENAEKYYGELLKIAGNSDSRGVIEAKKYMEK